MNTSSAKYKNCPCCAFDLFLPESLKNEENQSIERQDATTISSEADADAPQSPQQVIAHLLTESNSSEVSRIVLVDTHCHAQLERDQDETYDLKGVEQKDEISTKLKLKSVVCAVEPADWEATLTMATTSNNILPALGIHPWYLGDGLPDGWIQNLEELLVAHPSALVGEIGLCKMARWTRQFPEGKAAALAIQRDVFLQQFRLAAKLKRPVSVHCVNQHGVFLSVLKEIIEDAKTSNSIPREHLPPTIAMHSFTGTAHQASELLKLEQSIACGEMDSPLFYFGFSHTVNFVMNTSEKSRRKGREAVRSIPSDRILAESDVHSSSDLLGGTAGAIGYMAWARSETLEEIASCTSRNAIACLTQSIARKGK